MKLRGLRSLWLRFAIVAAVMLAAPAIIYQQLLDADLQRNVLLKESVAGQGRLIAEGLLPALDPAALPRLNEELARFGSPTSQVRLLFRPAGEAEDAYFFVAAAPPVPQDSIDRERLALLATGALTRLGPHCASAGEEGIAYEAVTGDRRIIASVAPVPLPSGCWVVILTRQELDWLGPEAKRSYWQAPEMVASAIVYVVMVGLVLLILLGVRRDLGRFTDTARRAGEGAENARFRDLNRLPELDGVARAFDRMVGNLKRSSQNLSLLAEENAHALKTPVGVIAQSLEPLRKDTVEDARRKRSVEMIDRSVERLDHLITVIRKSEETAATLVAPGVTAVDAGALLETVAEAYAPLARDRAITLTASGTAEVMANQELLRAALENPVENALELTPRGGSITLVVRKAATPGMAELCITDTGPGVPDHDLKTIFERRFSVREAGDGGHDGLGLWIVSRNMESMGGSAHAENADDAGLVIVLTVPVVGL
jgi:two-component system sensor histidine kinase ChvG